MNIFRKKSMSKILEDAGSKVLNPTMKTMDLILFGIAAIIGSGVMVLTGIASASAGPAVTFSFLISGLACGLAALCYAEMASAIPSSGSTYTYLYVSMGEFIAHTVGWLMIGGYILAAAAIANGWAGYFTTLLEGFGIVIPEQFLTLPTDGGFGNIPSLIMTLIITFILSKGMTESKLVNNLLALMKIAIVLLFVIVGAFYVKPSNWTDNFSPTGITGVMTGATLVFFAYLGFDAISTSAEETINPQETMPKAIIITLSLCTLLYVAVCLVLTGAVHYTQLGKGNALVYVLNEVGQHKAAGFISLGASIGLMAGVLSFMYAGIRISFTMARDGLLPPLLTRVNKNKVPGVMTWIAGIVTAFLAGFLPLGQLSELANVAAIIAFALVSYSTIVFRKSNPEVKRDFKVPAMPVIPILSIVLFASLLYSVTVSTWIILFVWSAIGILVYFGYSYKRSKI